MRVTIACLAGALIFGSLQLCAASVPAALTLVGETKVNTGGREQNTAPSITRLADGRFVVSWHDGGPTTGWGRVYAGDGTPLGSQFSLNPNCGSGWRYGHVTVPLSNGGIAAFWGGGCNTMNVQQFNSQFAPVGSNLALDLGAAADWPAVTLLTNGQILVAAKGHDSPSSVRMIQLDQSLNPLAAASAANVNPTGWQHDDYDITLAASPGGGYLLGWSNSAGDIIARRFDNSGTALGNEFVVNSSAGGMRANPNIVYNSRNEFWIAWQGSSGNGDSTVYLRRFGSDGLPLGPEWSVTGTTGGDQTGPQLAVGDDDSVAVSYTSPDSDGAGIFARLYNSSGSPTTGEFRVNQAQSGDQWTTFAKLRGSSLSGNTYLCAWRGTGTQGDGVYMTVLVNPTPAPLTLTPAAGSGASQPLTVVFSAPAGYQTLDVVNVLINTALDGRQACYLAYSVPANALYIVADNGDSTELSGKAMDGAGTVGNSQCTVALAGSSATGSGNTFTLVLNLSFSSSFGGNKVVYAAARDTAQNNSGWQTMGVHGVPPLPSAFPNPAGMSPSSGNTLSQTITFTYQDQSAANNLQTVWALINTALDGRMACYVAYYRPGNQLFLYPDNGDGSQAASMVLTGNNTLANSQCTISAHGAGAQTNGNTLTLTLPIAFNQSFAGFKGVWMAATTTGSQQTSPWQALGAEAVPAPN